MQEFSSISVSSFEAGTLAERLTEQSRDGWDVVAIVPTGATVTAYLQRTADGTAAPAAEAAPAEAGADQAGWGAGSTEPAAAAEITPEPASAPPAAASPAPAHTAAASAASAPAGWYADPSGRFELRYWDGSQWTEHVSRAGQQYTDPPVA